MEINEYNQEIKNLEKEFNIKKKAIGKKFVMANKPASIGDIVTDHYHSIRVESIGVTAGYNGPVASYYGVRLTKGLKPFKSGERSSIHGENLKSVNGVAVNNA